MRYLFYSFKIIVACVIFTFIFKIINYEKTIKDLKNENKILKIKIESNESILKKQINIIKKGNEFVLNNNKNIAQIQENINYNDTVLQDANDLKKKQKLLDDFFNKNEKK